MLVLQGMVKSGCQHFTRRFSCIPMCFERVTGEKLFPGTINVRVDHKIEINEHFRICGTDIGEPHQDLLMEVCRINGFWAYRIRPYNLETHNGGHGDNILEISCSKKLENVTPGSTVEVSFFR